MHPKWLALFLIVLITSCATKSFMQQEVANATKATDAKIGEMQRQVEATQVDVANLKKSHAAQTEQVGTLSGTASKLAEMQKQIEALRMDASRLNDRVADLEQRLAKSEKPR